MGNVFVSLDEEHENFLRRAAQEKGGKKGAISEIIQQALDELKEKTRKTIIKMRLKQRLRDGIDFEYKMYQKRSEIYE